MRRSNLGDKLVTDVASAEDGYNYVLYVSSGENSQFVIMRENTAQTEYRWFFGAGDPTTSWAARATLTANGKFVRPNQLSGRE